MFFSTATGGTLAERLRITSTGKILIGTTTPQGNANADDLVVSSGGTTGITIRSGGTSYNGNIFFARGTSGSDEYRGWITYDHSQQHLTFGTNAGEIFRAYSGRFGIGTASPSRTLEVRGPNDSHLAITVPGTTQTSALLFGDSGDDDIGAISYIHSDNSMRFVTNAAERLRITGDGPHLLLGGTSDVNEITESSANAGMVIGGTGFGNAGLAIITSTTGAGRLYFGDNILSDAGRNRGAIIYYHSSDHMHFQTAGSERLRIDSSGRLLIGTTIEGYVSADNLTVADSGNAGITIRSGTGNLGTIAFSDAITGTGEYDGYVAEPRAYEWDIAAGHAILEHAGGTVSDFEGNEILYGKKDLKNPSIILKNKNIL